MEQLKRILIKGGILSPNELKEIIAYARSLELKTIHFGSRQDIILPVHEEKKLSATDFQKVTDEIVPNSEHQNIVCSYVSSDIFPSTPWLNGSTYLYILEDFRTRPELKINICDPKQRLTPLFSGQLNFIASEVEDFWYLHFNHELFERNTYYPVLVYSWDIAKTATLIGRVINRASNVEELFRMVNENGTFNNRRVEHPLEIDYHPFPYYEGMNKMGITKYWLGLYWRNNQYDLNFLDEFCDFCLSNRIGKICLTAWKSFIVKGIPKESKLELERFLGRSGINVRHSLLELNWHLPVNDQEALDLKKFLVINFDQNDISTYGLTFGIANEFSRTYFTSIVIEKNQAPSLVKSFDIRPTYNVLHAHNFDPNETDYNIYAQDVDKLELPGLLMELSIIYFEQLGQSNSKTEEEEPDVKTERPVYQCRECLTVYDEDLGDANFGITAGTSFEDLPGHYTCSVCDAPKKSFKTAMLVQ